MTTITFSLSEGEKEKLSKRAEAVSKAKHPMKLTLSDLVRLAVVFQEKRAWKDIPEAAL